ncbi:DUF2252 domain-containing protein [Nocardia sp. BMG51109]|uniref:DUF2252 domain-containing protein n=1 Tax=Nocardia sp. BMG51109 TaxID=1056816 RepID=UPI0004663347|nr:DUF2252 domain-containing protein [Nocardia sp. BMG51109]
MFDEWLDSDEAYARGRALQEDDDHREHRDLALPDDRPAIVEFVQASNAGRMPELIPLRIGRMLESPFAFYRGSAALMAGDLAATPSSGLTAQLCGDAHAANFGLYGTADGRIVMDINDFDETAPGPWEWDLKRLVASLVLAGREAGVSENRCEEAAHDAARSYRRTIDHLARLPFLESWTALGDESIIDRAEADALLDDFAKASKKAKKNTSEKVAAKSTKVEESHWRFVADPPVLTEVSGEVAAEVTDALDGYVETLRESRAHLIKRYAACDVAFRVVGTGSVGLRNYLILLRGNGDEALVLQAKQARPTALREALGLAPVPHDGRRIVEGARLVQAETDILLGWATIGEHPYIVRQFRNRKGSIDVTELEGNDLDDYGRLAGALLARAHSRSIDPRVLAGYCEDGDRMDSAYARYALAYADRTEADHAELVRAVDSGVLPAEVEE